MRILVAYSMSSTFVQTTLDYLLALKRHLRAEVEFVHVTHGALMDFDFARYDVVLHNYCCRLCFPGHVSDNYQGAMRRFGGLKILAVQDEYDETDRLKAAIKDLGFDVVLTCVPPDSREYVYPRAEFPDVRFEQVLTGYVSDEFARQHTGGPPLADREIVLGYRGRDIGGRYGQLGCEKYIIGVRMKEICAARGIRHDIAVDEASRIYGPAWFDFVGSCRAMLGSESGSNVFDFDGSIARKYRELAEAQGGVVSYEAFAPFVAERERAVQMGQISPRVFECAAMRTPMVLFRGRYSDAIAPDEHYIPLEKDFSNADQVLDRLQDIAELERMTSRAHDHLVASGRFGYAAFVGRLQAIIDEELAGRSRGEYAILVAPPDPRELSVRGQRPTAVPGDKLQFEREQGRYYVGIYAGEVERLDRHVAIHVGTLHKEAARLNAVYRATAPRHAARSAAALPEALPLSGMEALLEAAAASKSAFERDSASLEQEARSGAATAQDAWPRLSERLQERIREINAELTALNLEWDRFVGQANALILVAEMRRQELALAETWSVLMQERARLESVFAEEHRRLSTLLARRQKAAPLPAALDFSAIERLQSSQAERARQRDVVCGEVMDVLHAGMSDHGWSDCGDRLRAQITAVGEDGRTLNATWDTAVKAANAEFAALAHAARKAAGLRGLPSQLRMRSVRAFSFARRKAHALARRGVLIVRRSRLRARGALQSVRAVWRRLRAG